MFQSETIPMGLLLQNDSVNSACDRLLAISFSLSSLNIRIAGSKNIGVSNHSISHRYKYFELALEAFSILSAPSIVVAIMVPLYPDKNATLLHEKQGVIGGMAGLSTNTEVEISVSFRHLLNSLIK
jgi:hypothetical protein